MIAMRYASQIEMFELDHKGIPGAEWWQGHWECQNFHGYFRTREFGTGNWLFVIPWFGNDDLTCTVYRLDKSGELVGEEVPIDGESRISVLDKKYSRAFWMH